MNKSKNINNWGLQSTQLNAFFVYGMTFTFTSISFRAEEDRRWGFSNLIGCRCAPLVPSESPAVLALRNQELLVRATQMSSLKTSKRLQMSASQRGKKAPLKTSPFLPIRLHQQHGSALFYNRGWAISSFLRSENFFRDLFKSADGLMKAGSSREGKNEGTHSSGAVHRWDETL